MTLREKKLPRHEDRMKARDSEKLAAIRLIQAA